MILPPQTRDLIGRGAMTAYFAACATLKALGVSAMAVLPDRSLTWGLDLMANVASLGFLVLVVVTTVARLPPKNSAEGIEPRISALIGTFATVTLIAFPQVEIPPTLVIASDALILIGAALCIWCLWWLGRSFSIMAQARRLVTAGPYRFVRHPLYACEAIVLAGIILRNPTWQALVVAAIALCFQYRRILNEERVLKATFREYIEYVAETPMLFPKLNQKRGNHRFSERRS